MHVAQAQAENFAAPEAATERQHQHHLANVSFPGSPFNRTDR
jgi:hypothetical protein